MEPLPDLPGVPSGLSPAPAAASRHRWPLERETAGPPACRHPAACLGAPFWACVGQTCANGCPVPGDGAGPQALGAGQGLKGSGLASMRWGRCV